MVEVNISEMRKASIGIDAMTFFAHFVPISQSCVTHPGSAKRLENCFRFEYFEISNQNFKSQNLFCHILEMSMLNF